MLDFANLREKAKSFPLHLRFDFLKVIDAAEKYETEKSRRGRMVVGGHGQTHWYECSECNTVVSPGWKCCPVCEVKFYEADTQIPGG